MASTSATAGKEDALRAWVAGKLAGQLLALPGIVSAWPAKRNGAGLAMARQDPLRITDRFLDDMLIIAATSNEAPDGARDGAAARLRNIHAARRPNEVQARC